MSDFIMFIATWLTADHAITLSGWIWLVICIPSALIIAGLIAVLMAVCGFIDGLLGGWF